MKRRQQAEAAEKRMKEQESRGVKDPAALKRKQERQDKAESEPSPGAGLRVSTFTMVAIYTHSCHGCFA